MMPAAPTRTDPNPTDSVHFEEEALHLLNEMEIYLASTDESGKTGRLPALRRRLQMLAELAGGRGLTALREACLLFQMPVCTSGETPATSQIDALTSVPPFLRCLLQCGLHPPESLPAEFGKYVTALQESIVQRIVTPPTNEETVTASADRTAPDPGDYGQTPTAPLRVLVCDDEDMVRDYIVDLVGQGEHIALGAENGRDGLAAVRTGLFDLVLTDINMPGLDGIQLLRQIKAECPEVEVIIITGYASLQNATEALRFGAYDYLTKPFQGASEIYAVLRRVREHIRLREGNRLLMQELRLRNEELNRYASSLEDALRSIEEKKQALVHADRMATLGVLSAGVAHEINNPTTFIRGNLQTLDKFWALLDPLVTDAIEATDDRKLRFVREEMPQLLRDMTAGTERITKIVSGLRSFSHQGASNTRIETNLGECIQSALDLVHNRIKNTITVEKHLPDLPPLQGDPQKLTQVFVNLFVNAADAMEGHADGRIRVRGAVDERVVTVEIADNGEGIPPAIRAKVFDPFFTTKSVGKGTGLGLSIILGIVQEHGGRITLVEPAGDEGAVFRIQLPRDPAVGVPEEEEPEKPRILVVEDDPQIRQVMVTAIGALGAYEVAAVKDGQEALTRIEASHPDVVLLDIMLPGMDGFEVLQRIRARPTIRSTKVVCLTAMDMPGVRDRLGSLGADGLFFKPIRFQELFATLGRLTNRGKREEGAHA